MPKTGAPKQGLKIPSIRILGVKKAEDRVIVDLSANRVKILKASPSGGGMVIENFKEQTFREGEDVQISQFLASTYAEWGIRAKETVCIVPSKLFISKNVDMPSNDPREISNIIDLQAGRYTPYSREEIVIDYLTTVTPGQHYSNVLLIIVNRKMIDKYLVTFERAGIFLDRIVISSEAMALMYRRFSGVSADQGAVSGIYIDEESSEFTIIDRNQMVFVRSIPVGVANFRGNQDVARTAFINELGKSITAYQDHGVGRAIQTLIMTGQTAALPFLENAIRREIPGMREQAFQIKAVPYESQFKTGPRFGAPPASGSGSGYFELASTLSALDRLRINLIPKEIKLKRRFHEGGKEIMNLGILIMICLLLICCSLGAKIYIKKGLMAKLESMYETTSIDAQALERASTKARVLRNLLEHRGKGLYVFDKVTSLIGSDIFLTEFTYDQEGNLHLLGTADSMSGVFAFVTKMEESGYFESVVTNETKTRRQGGKDVADFDIDCTLIAEI